MAMEGWMQKWYAHGLPKQGSSIGSEPKSSTDNGDINPETGRINLTWRWLATPTGESPTPPAGDAPAPTGGNGDTTKEAQEAVMTDQAQGVPTGSPAPAGAPADPAPAP